MDGRLDSVTHSSRVQLCCVAGTWAVEDRKAGSGKNRNGRIHEACSRCSSWSARRARPRYKPLSSITPVWICFNLLEQARRKARKTQVPSRRPSRSLGDLFSPFHFYDALFPLGPRRRRPLDSARSRIIPSEGQAGLAWIQTLIADTIHTRHTRHTHFANNLIFLSTSTPGLCVSGVGWRRSLLSLGANRWN